MNANYDFQLIYLIWFDFKILSYLTRQKKKNSLKISRAGENSLCYFTTG